ncbi:MAG: asparagine synthase C-terminal domain-containing protein [Acidimicrobiales bacterium]
MSLFDDEIDRRLGEFLALGPPPTAWTELDLASAALALEPTDAVVITLSEDEVLVARGGACNFPLYWTRATDSLLITMALPIDRTRRLSRTGLLASLAAVTTANQNEPNLTLRTPLSGWLRVRRGAVSRLSARAGCLSEHLVDLARSGETEGDRDHLIEALQSAMNEFGRRQQSRRRALVELSGGLDSSLAAIGARRHGIDLLGVSFRFPYYEFRFEESIQTAVAEALAIPRRCLDGSTLFPYAPSDWMPRLDEPAISVLSLKQALTVVRLAASEGMDRVLVGHGGDQLFAEDLLERETVRGSLARDALTKAAWQEVERARLIMESSSSYLRRSSLTFSYDARFDVTFKETFGTIARSPFTDLAWVRCGLSWARLSARIGTHPGKSILREAFASELPNAVTDRRGKVPWDGVCARGYTEHADAIVGEIERVREPLEFLGVKVRWLRTRVEELAGGRKSTTARDDREVIACYALATWLGSWAVERVADCCWDD